MRAPSAAEVRMPIQPSRRSFLHGALAGAVLGSGVAIGSPVRRMVGEDVAQVAPLRLKKAVKYDMIALEGTIEDRFALVKSIGFDGVEIDSPLVIDRDAVVGAAKKTGIVVHGVIDSVHWQTRFSDPDAGVREKAHAALVGAIDDAHVYGATTVLVVPGVVSAKGDGGREEVWKRSREEIAKALGHAKEKSVVIAIEVVWNDFITKPDELVAYVDEFEDEHVGAYLDCSNVVKFGVPVTTWIKKLGPRLVKLDFKGYSLEKGWVGIGEGDEDWPAIRAALSEVGYHGWATAEVDAGGREHLIDVKKRMDAVLGA
jgi:hexulose-6-phosphate isomerase